MKRPVPGEEKGGILRITPQMGILSRKKDARSSTDTEARPETAAPEPVAGPVEEAPAPDSVSAQAAEPVAPVPAEPVEEELARVERGVEEEETEIRLKASELLGPIRQLPA